MNGITEIYLIISGNDVWRKYCFNILIKRKTFGMRKIKRRFMIVLFFPSFYKKRGNKKEEIEKVERNSEEKEVEETKGIKHGF